MHLLVYKELTNDHIKFDTVVSSQLIVLVMFLKDS